MQKVLDRLFPRQIRWKGQLAESVVFLAVYIVWLLFHFPMSKGNILIGNVAVLIPLVASVVLIILSLPKIQPQTRSSWRLFGVGLLCWSVGYAIRTFEAQNGHPLPTFSLADAVNFLAYPCFFYALLLHPFENRYAPSRFRFLLDASITSGVVATLGWLILARPVTPTGPEMLVPLVYPIVDLIILMILFNMLLANRKARRTTLIWGFGFLAFLFSDFIYSTFAQSGSYQTGGAGNLGWVVGGLIFSLGSLIDADPPPDYKRENGLALDLGARIQNIFPVTLVLVLFGFVMADWQLSGEISILGLWMSLLLALILIARVGIRAGEAELYKYWQLFSSLAEPTFICDKGGRILLANPVMERLAGMTDDHQVVGLTLASICEDQALPVDLFERAYQRTCTIEIHLGPHRTPFLLTLGPIYSEGRKVLIAGAAHDLSEQKQQQEAIQKAYEELQAVYRELEELNTQLEQKVEQRTSTLQEAFRQLEEQNKLLQELDRLKSDFVSMVSHELRTPLTSINGGLELLLNRKGRLAGDQQPLLLLKNEVQRLTGFVENILNLSALEAGRLVVHKIPVSVIIVVQDACNKFKTLPGADRIKINLQAELPMVLSDPAFLESVLNHLIDNALKYAPAGSVTVDAIQQRGRLRIQVTDTGPGIPKEKRRLLYKRFQRLDAKDSQTVYGFGLGLYLSQRMLEAMGSSLAFEEPTGGGARFYFYLKLVR